MDNINSVVLCGRLTKDAERKTFQNSNNVKLSFRIAVNKRVKNGNEWKDVANFFDVEVWNVDYLKDALTKGRQVVVCGSLDVASWTDKNNQQVTKTYIKADRIQAFHSANEKKDEPKKLEQPPYDPTWDTSDIP